MGLLDRFFRIPRGRTPVISGPAARITTARTPENTGPAWEEILDLSRFPGPPPRVLRGVVLLVELDDLGPWPEILVAAREGELVLMDLTRFPEHLVRSLQDRFQVAEEEGINVLGLVEHIVAVSSQTGLQPSRRLLAAG
jgi:hypothetical protein